MIYRKFGNTDLKVSEVGLGCNKLGISIFNNVGEQKTLLLLQKALDLGVNIFDLAPTYNYGDTERLIGKAFQQRRADIVLVTKVGRLDSSLARYGKLVRPFSKALRPALAPFQTNLKKVSTPRFDFSKVQIEKSLQESLNRLRTDYIDLFLLHNPSIEILKKGDVFEVLERLKKAGYIRYYGASIDSYEEAITALKYPISGLQISFNLIQQAMGYQLFDQTETIKNIGLMVKTPFLRGLISSKQTLKKEYFDAHTAAEILKKNNALTFLHQKRSWNHTALQFILKHPQVSTVFCGTTSMGHLEDNIDYQNSRPFTSEEWGEIRRVQEEFTI